MLESDAAVFISKCNKSGAGIVGGVFADGMEFRRHRAKIFSSYFHKMLPLANRIPPCKLFPLDYFVTAAALGGL